jgi:hypothetical protein
MSQTSRRAFLAASGGGVAAAVAAPATTARPRSRAEEPLVAHVRDADAGTVALYHGDEEVVVTDHDLVRRLNRAAGR